MKWVGLFSITWWSLEIKNGSLACPALCALLLSFQLLKLLSIVDLIILMVAGWLNMPVILHENSNNMACLYILWLLQTSQSKFYLHHIPNSLASFCLIIRKDKTVLKVGGRIRMQPHIISGDRERIAKEITKWAE